MKPRQRNYQPGHRRDPNRKFNGRKEIDALYDKQWEAYRLKFLAINRECYACGKAAEVVDHLKPHKGSILLFKQTDNHIPLCIKCHNTVTTKFDRHYREGNPITDKILWLNRNRIPTESWTPKRVKVMPSYG
tara:strand:- start:204 stop:599 length:396 start_codon:yes stop_codon:yes gene_type:complete